MSDFPSIDELLNKTQAPNAPAGNVPASSVSNAPSSTVLPVSSAAEASLAKKMGDIALKEHEKEAMRLAAEFRLPHIDLEKFPIAQVALRVLSKERAETAHAICFFSSDDEFRIGAVDPNHPDVAVLIKEIEDTSRAHGKLYVISEKSFGRVIDLYKTLPTIAPITKDVSISAEDLSRVAADVSDFRALQALLDRASITDLLTYILGGAFKLDASDVHVESEETKVAVRYRLDGILHDAALLPKDALAKLISRVKLLSSLKINITEKPQDGRFTIKLPDGDVDVRVSTMPTVYGESIVMRLLRQNRESLTLESLGLHELAYAMLKQEIERPNGMIITTGPTGSGKTTTLYAALQLLNKPGVKIITLEDPVEYRIEGVNQSQIDHSKDYTFAKGLKSILRQDPDIAMVGEIRDLETAETAIQAALTGHLLLSTLHTNSAAGAIPRFLSMGAKPFLLAPALNCVIGQRLVRRLKDDKKVPATLTPEQMRFVDSAIQSMPEALKKEAEELPKNFFTAPAGVPEYEAYAGRIGIYEVMVVDDVMEKLILNGTVAEQDIESHAIQFGMATMAQDGIMKALNGITSIDEVLRVVE